ncbi:MAG: hypothetical protein ABFD91_08085 [Anaerohalosphaeraceae bacterium]
MNNNQIIRVVSPSLLGGETKNQDRAVFDKKSNTACVCDGTTSSPYSALAASLVAGYAPLILNNVDNLKVIAQLLYALRNKSLLDDVAVSPAIPESIRSLVRDAAKQGLKTSFQTTLVAMSFMVQDSCIQTKFVSCGDSGIFAFSSAGEVFMTNLSENQTQGDDCPLNTITFCPGSELLVKSEGPLNTFPQIMAQINLQNPDKWLLCQTICSTKNNSPDAQITTGMRLSPKESLLVPKYLFYGFKDPGFREYGRLYYSRFIRRLAKPKMACSDIHFDVKGNVTAVLPDHFSTGNWNYFEDRFPIDTHFLLCSDGFYRAFADPGAMWNWLTTNRSGLSKKASRLHLLNDLHHKLHRTCGDDDISFIWINPGRNNDAL